tara:strand:- start:10958 stop:12181 length:1224 start_codon:yes stop_codon:yes gene_type:complete
MSETVKQEGDFKIKKKRGRPKKLTQNQKETIKVDLSNKDKEEEKKEVENAVQEQTTEKVVLQSDEQSKETGEETKVGLQEVGETHEEKQITSNEGEKQEEVVNSPISEITEEEEEVVETKVEDVKTEVEQPKVDLPENIEKLVNFMKETGGTIDDYVRLNADYSNVDNDVLLREYYRKSKPHLDDEEINFLLEDNFSYDEELDEERDIRKKKLAYKEEIAKAKTFLEETKKKYYDEIKLRPGVTQDQQKAMDFFNRYNKEQQMVQEQHGRFKAKTKDFFNQEFKGFDFNVGEKKFRYGVKNTEDVANNQSDLTNLVGKFLDNKGEVKDYKGYHKAIYAAQNADTIANHFYEQGKADAVKDMMAKSKNITNEPRTTSTGDVYINGLRVKAVSGVDSSKLKLRINKNKT